MTTQTNPFDKLERLVQAEQQARSSGQELYEFLYALATQELFNPSVRELGRQLAAKLGENNFSPSSLTDDDLAAVADILGQLQDMFTGR
jgi:hypothetical protein